MSKQSRPGNCWLSPVNSLQPSWGQRSGTRNRTEPRILTDISDSNEELSAESCGGESASYSPRSGSAGPWASGNSNNGGEGAEQLWACPFCKWKPLRYQGCHTYKLKEISRVKQHLRRKHRIPPQCDVCLEEFADDEAKRSHVRRRSCCLSPTAAAGKREGVTPEQQELLERRAERNKSKVEQWYSIYEILFPGGTPPASPFVDLELSPHLHAFQSFLGSDSATSILDEATLAHVPPHIRCDEALALCRAVFEQAMPELLQRYETLQPGSSAKRHPELYEDEYEPDPPGSAAPINVPRLVSGMHDGLDAGARMDVDEICTLPSPAHSPSVLDQPGRGPAAAAAFVDASSPHLHQQLSPPTSEQASPLAFQQLGSPLVQGFCGLWAEELIATPPPPPPPHGGGGGSFGSPDMSSVYWRFDMVGGPTYYCP